MREARLDAEVGLHQHVLELLERRCVELALDERLVTLSPIEDEVRRIPSVRRRHQSSAGIRQAGPGRLGLGARDGLLRRRALRLAALDRLQVRAGELRRRLPVRRQVGRRLRRRRLDRRQRRRPRQRSVKSGVPSWRTQPDRASSRLSSGLAGSQARAPRRRSQRPGLRLLHLAHRWNRSGWICSTPSRPLRRRAARARHGRRSRPRGSRRRGPAPGSGPA